MPTREEAVTNIRRALSANMDTMNVARGMTKDEYVIWRTSGSWSGVAEVTLGDLRAVVQDA